MKTRPPQKEYTIEHLIEGPDGLLSPVKPEDLYIDNHRGVKEAFKLIYEWQRQKGKYAGSKEADSNYKRRKPTTYKK
jgi:hypothetical protein